MRSSWVGLFVVVVLVAGCGEQAEESASDEPSASSSPSTSSPSASAEPSPDSSPDKQVGAMKSCAELYNAPDLLIPRVLRLVREQPYAEEAADKADEYAAALADASAHAQPAMSEAIDGIRDYLEEAQAIMASGSEETIDVKSFDRAGVQLANRCTVFNG